MSTPARTVLCGGKKVRQVGNSAGRQFRVRLVREGEFYGSRDQLVNTTGEPLVEFFDATYAGDDHFGPLGQFVSRYDFDVLREVQAGLNLDGGSAAWFLDAEPVADVKEWVEQQLG